MGAMVNRRITLAARPTGMPELSDFALVEEPVAGLLPGNVLVGVDVLSIDAFIRTVMEERAFHGGVPVGTMLPALGVGRVLQSTVADLEAGDSVFGRLGAQTIVSLPAAALRKLGVSKVPATTYLAGLGVATGVTAYFGIEVAAIKPGDTVVVSAAAGAVGSIAGQIARIAGAGRVIGVAGGPEKVTFLVDELGFDAGVDYKSGGLDTGLCEAAPNGIDVFFDNVGGEILDAVLMQINVRARIVICGGIAHYQDMDHVIGPRNYLKLAERHARMEGFAVNHFASRYHEAETALARWIDEGRLVVHEQYEHGIDRFPHALRMLLSGGNRGKLLLDLR